MDDTPESKSARIERLVERSVEQAVFGDRRDFLKLVGASAAVGMFAHQVIVRSMR